MFVLFTNRTSTLEHSSDCVCVLLHSLIVFVFHPNRVQRAKTNDQNTLFLTANSMRIFIYYRPGTQRVLCETIIEINHWFCTRFSSRRNERFLSNFSISERWWCSSCDSVQSFFILFPLLLDK